MSLRAVPPPDSAPRPMLRLANVRKTFNPRTSKEVRALQGNDITLDQG